MDEEKLKDMLDAQANLYTAQEKLKDIMHANPVYDSNNVAVTNLSGTFGGIYDTVPTPAYYSNDYEKLLDQISTLCLPDQADKVIVKMLDIIKGYDAEDTHRHVTDLLMQIARKHVGL
jgi:cobalamin biosynthesis Co2+ chelatase CbiK